MFLLCMCDTIKDNNNTKKKPSFVSKAFFFYIMSRLIAIISVKEKV